MYRNPIPFEKIHEAWSALADGRVEIAPGSTEAEGSATVTSSSREKSYKVTWRDQGSVFTSDDSATFWRGYPGYPVIAVLMKQGRIPFDSAVAGKYKGINWTELNARHKRDYAAALAEVERERGIDASESEKAAQSAYDSLMQLPITLKRK